MSRVCSKGAFQNHPEALLKLNLQSLEQRRKELCLNFSKDSIKYETLSDLFPTNDQTRETRNPEKYKVMHANTDRLRNSSIIYMQNLLNEEFKQEQLISKNS